MIKRSETEAYKVAGPVMLEAYPYGAAIMCIIDDRLEWTIRSKKFGVSAFKEGDVVTDATYKQCMALGQRVVEKVDDSRYGYKLMISAEPIMEGDNIIGAMAVIVPRPSPMELAFNVVGPIIGQVFPDGAFTYMTDTVKFTHRYGDERFDLPNVQAGLKLNDNAVAVKSMREKRSTVMEIDASMYGEVCLVGNFPLYDDDDPSVPVGTFGVATPKRLAVRARGMSVNLHEGMSQIAAAIEELAASSFEIHENEMSLNANVQEIAKLSDDINTILEFIKQIAEETKMLGLNAAIEAARAGEAGRGFGVVAEEIRKLSDESKETVTKIHVLTGEIKTKIGETIKNSNVTLHSSQEQAAATEEITAQVEELNGVAEELDKIAQVI